MTTQAPPPATGRVTTLVTASETTARTGASRSTAISIRCSSTGSSGSSSGDQHPAATTTGPSGSCSTAPIRTSTPSDTASAKRASV